MSKKDAVRHDMKAHRTRNSKHGKAICVACMLEERHKKPAECIVCTLGETCRHQFLSAGPPNKPSLFWEIEV